MGNLSNWARMLVIFVGLGIVGIIGYSGWKMVSPPKQELKWHEIKGATFNVNDEKIKQVKGQLIENQDKINLSDVQPFTVLMLGVDTDTLSGRSDTMILATVNPKKNSISMLSIPRDSRVKICGKNTYEKITHAHAYGTETAICTVQEAFGVPVNYYVKINFKGFQEAVDALGGLDMYVEKDITFRDRIRHQEFTLKQGQQKLDGYQALNYARFRKDGEGDYGRMRRQQQVIKAMVNQTKDTRNVTTFAKLLGILGQNMETNLSKKEMLGLMMHFKEFNGESMENIDMKSYPKYIPPYSFVIIEDKEMQRVSAELKQRLAN